MIFANRRHFGLTLTEVLVSLVVLLILITVTARLGQYVKTRSAVQLADSLLSVIDTALQLYYEDYQEFPPQAAASEAGFEAATGTAITVVDGAVSADYWSSAALYFTLNRSPHSRDIIAAVSSRLISAADAAGRPIVIQLANGERKNLLRFVDPWGGSLWYEYLPGDHFPRLRSAGPDGQFGTEDDIENK